MRKVKNPPLGESFDEFLKEEGIFEAVQETAIKRVRAWQLEEAMKAQRLDPSRAGIGAAGSCVLRHLIISGKKDPSG